MAISTDELTVKASDIMSQPLRQRQEMANRGLLDVMLSTMTPGQIAATFPSYIKDFTTGGKPTSSTSNIPAFRGGAGGGNITPRQQTAREKKEQILDSIVPAGLVPGPDGKPVRPTDLKKVPGVFQSREDMENYIREAAKKRGIDPEAAIKLYKSEGAGGQGPSLQSKIPRGGAGSFNGFEDSHGPFQLHRGGAGSLGTEFEKKTNLKIDDPTTFRQQIDFALDYAAQNGWAPWAGARVAFRDDQGRVNFRFGISDEATPVGISEYNPDSNAEYVRQPTAFDLSQQQIAEATIEETATPLTGDATFYDDILATYPEKIGLDSDLWGKIDPALALSKRELVSATTGEIGLATLLAADASAKVLRKNGYEPRPVSGGDLHSANHGAGQDANYSIDMAASIVDSSGNLINVQGGELPREVRFKMIGAAKLATYNSGKNFRSGLPATGDYRSVHIQTDPAKPAALWAYIPGIGDDTKIDKSVEGLQLQKYLNDFDNLKAEDRTKILSDLTGLKVKEETPATAETAPQTVVTKPDEPAISQDTAAPINVEKYDATQGKFTFDDIQSLVKGETLLGQADTGGTIAAAGGAEIDKPYFAQPVDGAGPNILMGETGPETITPRHRADDFGIQSYQMQQMPAPEPAMADIVGSQNIQQPQYLPKPSFAQEPRQTPVVAEHTPIPPSLRKQYADSKMQNRLDNLSPIGSVYSNFGYA